MGEGEPVPVLSEHQHADDGQHVGVAGPGLEADGHVSAAGVDDALSEDGAQLGHHVVVLVSDHLIEICRTRLIKGKHKYYLLGRHHNLAVYFIIT